MLLVMVLVMVFLVHRVFVRVTVPVTMIMAAAAFMRRTVQEITPNAPRRVAPDVAADPRKGGPRLPARVGAGEGRVVAAEEAAADLAVEVRGQHEGDFNAVIVVGIVEIDAVGKRTVREVIAVGVLLVEVTQGPQRPSRLDAEPVGQPGAGQGLDIRFLQLDLGRLARMDAKAEGELAVELVVDIAGDRDLGMVEAEALGGTLGFVAELKARYLRPLGGELGVHAIENNADRRVEDVVRSNGPRRRFGCARGGLRFRSNRRQLGLKRLDARLVFALEGLYFSGQFRRCW